MRETVRETVTLSEDHLIPPTKGVHEKGAGIVATPTPLSFHLPASHGPDTKGRQRAWSALCS